MLANEEVIDGKSERRRLSRSRSCRSASGCCASPPYADRLARRSRRRSTGPRRKAQAARLDRPQRGRGRRVRGRRARRRDDHRLHDARRHALRRDVRRARARARAASTQLTHRRADAARSTPYVAATRRRATSIARDVDQEKTGVATGAFAINPLNGDEGPDLDRRLRHRQLRHRRGHGRARARRARSRVRRRSTACRSSRSSPAKDGATRSTCRRRPSPTTASRAQCRVATAPSRRHAERRGAQAS